jgi:hypothetical protein
MTSRQAGMPDPSSGSRFRFSLFTDSWSFRLIPPVWVRLGSRESWAIEDARQMLKPLKPPRKRR